MISTSALNNHISMTSCPDVKDICRDFMSKTGISFISHCTTYLDGSRAILNTSSEAVSYIVESNFMTRFMLKLITQRQFNYIPAVIEDSKIDYKYRNFMADRRQLEREKFHIDYKLVSVKYYKSYYTSIAFVAPINHHSIVNYYFSHLGDINNFIDFFEIEASGLLKKARENPIIAPWYKPTTKDLQRLQDCHTKNMSALNRKDRTICTRLSNGLTAKQIAEELHRSPRTIESRLDELRARYNCDTRSQLAAKFATQFPYLIEK